MENKDRTDQFFLTDREKEVLQYLAKGYSAKLIAELLSISKSTAISHCEHLKEKLDARNTPELINLAWELGILGST